MNSNLSLYCEWEVWLDIKNYEGRYKISNFGRVKSLPRKYIGYKLMDEKILQPKVSNGYYRIGLRKPGKHRKFFGIHQLIAYAFIENPNNYPYVLHNDDIKTRNAIDNLRFGTSKQNKADAIKNGRFNEESKRKISETKKSQNLKGEKSHSAKPVKQIDIISGKIIKIWQSATDAANGINQKGSRTVITNVCKKYIHKNGHPSKTAAGFYWEYV